MKHNRSYLGIFAGWMVATTLSAQPVSLIATVEIPAGSFYMGSEGKGAEPDEVPIHKVIISHPFRMGVTEVTNAQYEQFRPEHKLLRGKDGVSTEDNDAVVNVSYQDALDFCEWLGQREGKTYRLPTEAEWEYACRAGTYTSYNLGDKLSDSIFCNQIVIRDFVPVSLQVKQTPPNAFGLYDMHGNVEEWCSDWYGAYTPDEQTDPVGPVTGEFRVTRGGSYHTFIEYLRSANRMAMIPDDRHSRTGFRVVQSDYPLTTDVQGQAFFLPPIPFVLPPDLGSDTPFYVHNHQPSVTWCDNGDLLAAWFSTNEEDGREMVVLSSRLKPGKAQWEKASLFFKVPDRNMTGTALFNDGNGTLYHFNGVEAAGDWQNLALVMRTSTDNGFTWTAPRLIAPEHTQRHQVISGTSQTPEGWLLQACDAGPGGDDGTALHISKNGGQTWEDPWDGAPLPKLEEGRQGTTIAGIHAGVVTLKDGSLFALGRGLASSITDKDGRRRMPLSLSTDYGKTWTYHASEFPPIDGGQRLVLMRLKEGPLLLVSFTDHPLRTPEAKRGMDFTDKDGHVYKGYGVFAAVSYDEGKTWPVRKLLTDGQERFLNGGAWTGTFVTDATHAEPRGYLAGTQSPDGTIHILSSRLHYRFNLAWLEQ